MNLKTNDLYLHLKDFILKNKMLFCLLCAGIVVLIFLVPSDSIKTENTESSSVSTVYTLENEMEEKLESFLKNVKGVGKVKVCVTFDSLEYKEYAQDSDIEENEEKKEKTTDYVIVENKEGDENGLLIRTTAPKIRGVAVCCEGADSQVVKNEVTCLLTAMLEIPSNRVYVTAYKIND